MQFESAPEHKRALYEVERCESYLDVLRSVHEECSNPIDWNALATAEEPAPPERTTTHEDEVTRLVESYVPNWFDKLFGRAERAVAALRADIEAAKRTDAWSYEQAVERYDDEVQVLHERRRVAEKVLGGETTAFVEVLETVDPFREIRALGSLVEIEPDLRIRLQVNAPDVIPRDTKSLKPDGQLWVRPASPEQIEKVALEYASSCTFRIASEVLALLPVDRVSVSPPMFDVTIPRASFERVDLADVDVVSATAAYRD